MVSEKIRKIIQELLQDILKEMNTTGSIEGYNIPRAFARDEISWKKRNKKYAIKSLDGYEIMEEKKKMKKSELKKLIREEIQNVQEKEDTFKFTPKYPASEYVYKDLFMRHKFMKTYNQWFYPLFNKYKNDPDKFCQRFFEINNVPDCQDYIAKYPMKAFYKFINNTPAYKKHDITGAIEPYTYVVGLINGEDMAGVIFKRYFMSQRSLKWYEQYLKNKYRG